MIGQPPNGTGPAINWDSGTRYLLSSNIVGPRIVRFGVKFD
jgi:hypothetical protein